MNLKLEEQQEQRFQKQIIYSVTRDYGAVETAVMMGLREDQTDLVYKYGNNPDLPIPAKRWRMLSQGLTKRDDQRIIREYAHPSVLISLFQSGKLNGCYKDELLNIVSLIGKISEECNKDSINAPLVVDLIEQLANEGATMKKEVKQL